MTAALSDREREKARLSRFRDMADRLAGDVWTMEAEGGVTQVFSARASGETVCLCTIHADALPAEYEVLCAAFDMLTFFLALQDRAAAKVRELMAQLGQNDRAAKAKDFAAQAAMLCQSGSFRAFLATKGGPVLDAQAADTRMKSLLSITSKKQINDDQAAQARFKSLRGDYDLWMKGGLS